MLLCIKVNKANSRGEPQTDIDGQVKQKDRVYHELIRCNWCNNSSRKGH